MHTNGIGACVTGLLLLVFLAVSIGPLRAVGPDSQPPLSPRLAALVQELEAGNHDAPAAFWRKMANKTPLVEPIPGDDRHCSVTFLWRGDGKTTNVALLGGFAGPNLTKPLSRLRETDVWYLTERHPTDARFQYLFLVNGPQAQPADIAEFMRAMQQGQPRPDPLNTRESAGWSYVELRDAPPQPWIRQQPGTPRGQVLRQTFKSKIMDAEYPLTLYTPPGYAENRGTCWLMIAFDGGFPMMEVTLDNLLAAGKIPPLVVVGVGNVSQETRNRDLGGSEKFAAFLVNEVVLWARKTYRVYPDAARTLVGGSSLGGFMAVYCGLKQSKTFGRVLALSPTLVVAPGQDQPDDPWIEESPGLMTHQFAAIRRLPVDFYLGVGRYENFYLASLLSQARRLRDVLDAKGYRVTYAEFDGGHNEVCWRGCFADAVIALTATKTGSPPESRPGQHRDP